MLHIIAIFKVNWVLFVTDYLMHKLTLVQTHFGTLGECYIVIPHIRVN